MEASLPGTVSIPWAENTARYVIIRYVFPVTVAAALIAVELVSDVGLDLWIISGDAAAAVVYTYCGLLLASLIVDDKPQLHHVGTVLGVICMAGRTGSFLELVIEGETHLLAAVLERLVILVAVILWHGWGAYQSTAAGLHKQQLVGLNPTNET